MDGTGTEGGRRGAWRDTGPLCSREEGIRMGGALFQFSLVNGGVGGGGVRPGCAGRTRLCREARWRTEPPRSKLACFAWSWSTEAAVVWPLGPLDGAGGAPRVTVFRKPRPEGPGRQPGPGSECLTGSQGGVHCVFVCISKTLYFFLGNFFLTGLDGLF